MGPTNEVHVVFVEEFGDHVGAEGEGHAAVVLAPAEHVLVRVGPQQVAQEALVGHVRGAHDPPDLLHGLEVRGQACGDGKPPPPTLAPPGVITLPRPCIGPIGGVT
ncbi:hypothetical protein EYF80_038089 [Liparis tanakae]|uniref:Uncharacterized protein n=1 Tax=Liparis tanakae TaxID=230148 RepID=A0A4Z2GDN2_9TELE|nr:hypothetical protein EYF80_038089 [Liparis tanakae]